MLQDARAHYFISDEIIKIIFGPSRPLRFRPFPDFARRVIQNGDSVDGTSQAEGATQKTQLERLLTEI